MPNQYTNFDYENQRAGKGKQFSVSLNPELKVTWETMAKQIRMKEADLFREMIPIEAKRVRDFYTRYPDYRTIGIGPVLNAIYDASQIALAQEWRREDEVMRAYQEAKRKDGGKVNYELNNRAIEFHLKAWAKGLSVKELLENYAKKKAETREAYHLEDDTFLADDPDPATEPQTPPEPAKVRDDPPAFGYAPNWRGLVLVALVAVVLVAVGALVGFILANVTRV